MTDWNDPDEDAYHHDEDDHEVFGTNEDRQLLKGRTFSSKVPPQFRGDTSWFSFEDAIEEWCSITNMEPRLRGPNLKNSLLGNAHWMKPLLNIPKLQDEQTGVQYFIRTLRPHFIKGNEHVFLWRFLRFINLRRGGKRETEWIPRFTIDLSRTRNAWRDMFTPVRDVTDINYITYVTRRNNVVAAQSEQWNHEQAENIAAGEAHTWYPQLLVAEDDNVLEAYNEEVLLPQHVANFPLTDHLVTLIFVVSAEMTEQQRDRFVAALATRGIPLSSYTFKPIAESYRELSASAKTGISDPNVNTGGRNRERTDFLLESGDWVENGDEENGYWCLDEQTGEEGFYGMTSEVFWTFDEKEHAWVSRKRWTCSFQKSTERKRKRKNKKQRKI